MSQTEGKITTTVNKYVLKNVIQTFQGYKSWWFYYIFLFTHMDCNMETTIKNSKVGNEGVISTGLI